MKPVLSDLKNCFRKILNGQLVVQADENKFPPGGGMVKNASGSVSLSELLPHETRTSSDLTVT